MRPFIRCSWILIRSAVSLTDCLGLDGDRCIRVIPRQRWREEMKTWRYLYLHAQSGSERIRVLEDIFYYDDSACHRFRYCLVVITLYHVHPNITNALVCKCFEKEKNTKNISLLAYLTEEVMGMHNTSSLDLTYFVQIIKKHFLWKTACFPVQVNGLR